MRISDWSSDVCSSDLCLAPALLRACIFRSCRAEQRASANVGIECIGTRRNDEFAELAYTAFLTGLRFRFERLQLRIDIAGFAAHKSPLSDEARKSAV